MTNPHSQILTVAQMQAAEQALIEAGTGVDALMQLAGRGAAEWIYRLAWPKPVTVLCGPGNNGGDGYVIAEALRECGLPVTVVEAFEPTTEAAHNARAAYAGGTAMSGELPFGAVLVDCLFGSGLTRPLPNNLLVLLNGLASAHPHRIAIDLPSGIDSDSGEALNDGLPDYDLTLALGAWKFAHWLMPATATMGELHLVGIGVDEVVQSARLIDRPPQGNPAWSGDSPDPSSSAAPWKIYNVGNNRPEELMHVVALLEKEFGRPAIKEMLPMQPGDVPATYADIEDLARDAGFRPSTTIEDGIARFSSWFREYHRMARSNPR